MKYGGYPSWWSWLKATDPVRYKDQLAKQSIRCKKWRKRILADPELAAKEYENKKAYQKRYNQTEERKAYMREYMRKYYATHTEEMKANTQRWKDKNEQSKSNGNTDSNTSTRSRKHKGTTKRSNISRKSNVRRTGSKNTKQ